MPRVKTETLNWDTPKADYKRKNDQRIYTHIINHLVRIGNAKRISMLTFPAADWVFESNFLEMVKDEDLDVLLLGLEENMAISTRFHTKGSSLETQYPKCYVNSVSQSLRGYLDRPPDKRNIVYLDWMGTWDRGTRFDVDLLFQRHIFPVRALLVLTVMLNRGGKEYDAPDIFRLYNENKLNIPIDDIHDRYLSLLDAKRRKGKEGITDNFMRKVNGIPHSVREIAMENDYFVDNVDIDIYPGKETDTEFGKNGRAVRKHNYEISFIFNIRKRFAALRGGPYGKESYKPLVK